MDNSEQFTIIFMPVNGDFQEGKSLASPYKKLFSLTEEELKLIKVNNIEHCDQTADQK